MKLKPIYCFSGLGADERVFKFLKVPDGFELIPVSWIEPQSNETIYEYATRISNGIKTDKPFGVLGVSFGGVVATEVSKLLKPEFTIIISSVSITKELPLILRFTPVWFFKGIPTFVFNLPSSLANYLFGAQNKKLLKEVLKDTDPRFVKWALMALKSFNNHKKLKSTLYLSGGKDRLFATILNSEVIANAGHFMIVDRAEEVSKRIEVFLKR